MFIEIELEGVKVLEAELVSGFVPQQHQLFEVRLDHAADRFAALPDGLEPLGILGFL